MSRKIEYNEDQTEIRCTRCKQFKPAETFHFRKDRPTCNYCYDCYHAKNLYWSNKLKDSRREQRYGISGEQYRAMLIAQNHQCKICDKDMTGQKICVEHNHSTNQVRGLVHDSCNRAIGLLQDDATILYRAAKYIEMDGNI